MSFQSHFMVAITSITPLIVNCRTLWSRPFWGRIYTGKN